MISSSNYHQIGVLSLSIDVGGTKKKLTLCVVRSFVKGIILDVPLDPVKFWSHSKSIWVDTLASFVLTTRILHYENRIVASIQTTQKETRCGSIICTHHILSVACIHAIIECSPKKTIHRTTTTDDDDGNDNDEWL